MKNISLSEKLIIYFLTLGIGAIIIISVFAFFSTKNALISRTFDQLTSLRTVKQHQIELFFNDRIRDLSYLATSEDTREIAGGGKLPQFSSYLLKNYGLSNYFSDVYIINKSRNFFLAENFEKNSIQIQDVKSFPSDILSVGMKIEKEKVIVWDMVKSANTEEPFLLIGSGITGEKSNEPDPGVILLKIPVKAINAIMLNNNPESGLGKTGETYLIGRDFLMRSSSRFISNSIMRTKVRTQSAFSAFTGKEGCMTTRDYRNKPVLSSYSKPDIPGLDWILLSEIDQEEAMKPIYHMRNSILFLGIFISLIFFAFVFLIARMITRPIIHLRDAAVKVGMGEYNIHLPSETNDEIGSLTEAFNTMALQIHQKTRELQFERLGRMRSVIDGEESERQRLSRELHDGIGQSLVALKLRLESLLYINNEDRIKENIMAIQDQFDGTIDEIRRISNNLMPSVLEVFGITIALKNLCNETGENSGIKVFFECTGELDTMHTKLKTYIYRISQEALNNIIKHSGATELKLRLNREEDLAILQIDDNGRGFILEEAAMERGNGLYNMRERVTLLHGSFKIDSVINKGTNIIVKLPIF